MLQSKLKIPVKEKQTEASILAAEWPSQTARDGNLVYMISEDSLDHRLERDWFFYIVLSVFSMVCFFCWLHDMLSVFIIPSRRASPIRTKCKFISALAVR